MEEEKNEKKKSFWKDKKNVAIVILSFLVFCFLVSSPSEDTAKLNSEVQTLSTQVEDLNKELEEKSQEIENLKSGSEFQAQIEDLNKQISDKDTHIKNIEAQVQTLTQEKENLNSQISELTAENQNLKNQTTITTSSSQTTSSTSTQKSLATNSYTVYVTKTGNKYHRSGCSYLRQSKIAKDKNTAISEGYTACSRCNP